jgi:hypothetical protein
VVQEDATAWIAAADALAPPPSSGALLLGTYDEMTVAYRDLRNVHAGGLASTQLLPRPILIDGETVGSWRRVLGRREVVVEATLETRLSAEQHTALRAAADRFGAFVGLPARLKPMTG